MKSDNRNAEAIKQRQLGVQAKGRGSCPLNVSLYQEITGLSMPTIVAALDALAEDGTIRLGLSMPDHDEGHEVKRQAG